MSRKVMQQALEALVAVSDELICRATHHKKKDQHGSFDACPNLRRHQQTIAVLHAAIAQPAQPSQAPTYSELDIIASDLQALCDRQALRLEALEAQEPVYSSGLRARSQTE